MLIRMIDKLLKMLDEIFIKLLTLFFRFISKLKQTAICLHYLMLRRGLVVFKSKYEGIK